MREIPGAAHTQFGAFTLTDDLRDDWTRGMAADAARSGKLIRLRRGVYALPMSSQTPQERDAVMRTRAAGAVLGISRSVASHFGAAALHGLPIFNAMSGTPGAHTPLRPCITLPPGSMSTAPEVHVHRAMIPPADLRRARSLAPGSDALVVAGGSDLVVDGQQGLPVTSVARTIIDVGREHGVDAGLVMADAALHQSLTSSAALRAVAESCALWPGGRRAVRMLDLVDARSESVLETISRLAMRRCGFPDPELQVTITTEEGRFVARLDFFWPELGIGGEADGSLKYDGSNPLALVEEKLRQEKIEALGVPIVRWGWADVFQFHRVVARLDVAATRAARLNLSNYRASA